MQPSLKPNCRTFFFYPKSQILLTHSNLSSNLQLDWSFFLKLIWLCSPPPFPYTKNPSMVYYLLTIDQNLWCDFHSTLPPALPLPPPQYLQLHFTSLSPIIRHYDMATKCFTLPHGFSDAFLFLCPIPISITFPTFISQLKYCFLKEGFHDCPSPYHTSRWA